MANPVATFDTSEGTFKAEIFLAEMPLIKYCEDRAFDRFGIMIWSVILFALSFIVFNFFPIIAKKVLDWLKGRKVYAKWSHLKPKSYDRNLVVIGAGFMGAGVGYVSARAGLDAANWFERPSARRHLRGAEEELEQLRDRT